jgi:hypothetical protein
VAAPASTLAQPHAPAAASPRLAGDSDRYRLHVVATTIADVVTSIGGLIFDRAMAGWDVTVAVDGDGSGAIDDRALRILGARVAASPSRPQVLAVATDVFVANEAVRRVALASHTGMATEVLLWGRRHPPKLNRRFVPVRHHPSAAAHVFKSHALTGRATSAPAPMDEGFYSMG